MSSTFFMPSVNIMGAGCLPEAVLGVIIGEYDLYADEQIGRIAREMGFAEELSAVLDRLDR